MTAGVRGFESLEEQVFAEYTAEPRPAFTPSTPGVIPPRPTTPVVRTLEARHGARPGPAHVLMTGFAMDNTSDPERLKLRTNLITNPIAGWWREVGKGRLVYLSVGASPAAMNHPSMQRLYENAFRWLGREP